MLSRPPSWIPASYGTGHAADSYLALCSPAPRFSSHYQIPHGCVASSWFGFPYHYEWIPQLWYPEGPSTQYLRTLVPNTIKGMVFGTRDLKYLDPLVSVLRPEILEERSCKQVGLEVQGTVLSKHRGTCRLIPYPFLGLPCFGLRP